MSNPTLEARIVAAQQDVSDAEQTLRQLTLPGSAHRHDVILAARAKLLSARDILQELNAMLAASDFQHASSAVVDAERNLTKVLDELLAAKRTTIATAAVLEALERLDKAKGRLSELQDLTRTEP